MGANQIARTVEGKLELRTETLRARWALDDLVTADGHKLRGAFMCSIRPINEPAERKVFGEVFLAGKSSASIEDVVAHFATSIQTTAANTAATKTVAEWLADGAKDVLATALHKAGDRVAFNCGLELLPPFQVDLESPSFQQQKLEQMERNLAEQRVAGQVEHFEKAAALLKHFDSLRQAAPQLTPGAVLGQMSPSEQGVMLQTLLLAAGKEARAQALWGVAGQYLVKIDPRVSPPKTELVNLPADLGPLRSVEPAELNGEHVLLVGARGGVMIIRPDSIGDAKLYRDPEITSQLGFSRSLIWRDQLWACHGEAGVVGWELASMERPKFIIRPAQLGMSGPAAMPTAVSIEVPRQGSPRNLTRVDDDRLVFSVGSNLFAVDRDAKTTPLPNSGRSDVVSILADARNVYVVCEDGTVSLHDPRTLAVVSQECRTGRTNGAALLPWLGSTRLLLVTDDGPVVCVGTEDGLVTQYVSNHRGLRVVTAAADVIAAVSADRQRLVIWNSWEGRKPAAEFSVSSVAKHRLGDVHFA